MSVSLKKKEVNIFDENSTTLIRPNGSWRNIGNHYLSVISDPWYRLVMELQHKISLYTMQFYEQRHMKTLHLPITTGSISSPMGLGSDSSPVKVNICNVDTYLSDSMQFMLEYGCRIFKEGCYYIMPSFRGELADKRHLCQFYHSEAEILGTLDDVITLVEDYLKYLCENILESSVDIIKQATKDVSHIEKLASFSGHFPRITFDEAIERLDKDFDGKETYKVDPHGFRVINSYGEHKLMDMFNGLVWLTHFDRLAVPFYQAFNKENPQRTNNADLLFGIGEVVGSGERHQNENEVLEALKIHGVEREQYEWYCTMKKTYPLKTSGFGMGIERFLLWILKHDDIRDCQVLPRFNGVNIIP